MKRALFQGAAMLMAMSAGAFAQTPASQTPAATLIATTPTVSPSPTASPKPPADAEQQNGPRLRSQIKSNLEQAGFTDVTITADSFVVQATDKSGNPVIMFLDPDSMTMMTSDAASGGKATSAPAATGTAATGPASSMPAATMKSATAPAAETPSKPASIFATIPAKDDLSSKMLGLNVYNAANQNIGTIKDIAFAGRRVQAYIVGVGGFLGLGDHYVAVLPSAVSLTYSATDKTWHAAMDTDAAALKAAPEYKYAS